MINYLFTALLITVVLPAFGMIMGLIRKLVYKLVAKISPKFAFVLINYLTFPGVMHHELSHALVGWITGAKIHRINLFKPSGMSLGSVEISYKGPWILRSLQSCFSSAAPVFCGVVTFFLVISFAIPNVTAMPVLILIYYLLFSLLMHMTMSMQDLKCYTKGCTGLYLIVFIACLCFRFDILSYIML